MPKSAANPLPDPLPSEGGSYLLDPATGKWELLDRTEPAKLPSAQLPATELPSADVPAELPSVEVPAELPTEPPTDGL